MAQAEKESESEIDSERERELVKPQLTVSIKAVAAANIAYRLFI